jgi:hypothetical protein
MPSRKKKLNMIMRLGVELTEVKDVDVLLERSLNQICDGLLLAP